MVTYDGMGFNEVTLSADSREALETLPMLPSAA